MARQRERLIANYADFLAFEEETDRALTGISLTDREQSRLKELGAHDPTPTHYFILEKLFEYFSFGEESHLLDVGCGSGRVLAFFSSKGYPGRATGVELDPELADTARSWAQGRENLEVLQGSVLDLNLDAYTDFYLFNPFDQGILQRFIESVECQMTHPCTVVHMSDNGDTWHYVGRTGWTQLDVGSFQLFRNARGYAIKVFDWPQHYSVWRFDGA